MESRKFVVIYQPQPVSTEIFDNNCRKVLKEISVGDLQPDETVDAMHEANLLRNLDHPGIVKFHDSFIDQENFCIITEYCEVRIRLQKAYLLRQARLPLSVSSASEVIPPACQDK